MIADLAAQTGLGLRFQRMKERAFLSLREEVEATILFSDIRGFSSLAERLPPREVVYVVVRNLEAMVEVATSQRQARLDDRVVRWFSRTP